MPAYATVRVDMALGGSYRQEVSADVPLGWWRLSEKFLAGGSAIRDSSGHGRHGSAFAGVSPAVNDNPESGGGIAFDGTTAYITMGDVAAFEFTTAFAVEFWIDAASNPGTQRRIVGKQSGTAGWRVDLTTSGLVSFYARNSTDTVNAWLLSSLTSVTDGDRHHVVCAWQGGTTGNVFIFIDGVTDIVGDSTTTTLGVSNADFMLAAAAGPTLFLPATLSDVALYTGPISAGLVARHYAAGFWTDVTDDVLTGPGQDMVFGISGNGPLDRLADVGTLTFWLRNDSKNSAGLMGYYSPQNANVRAGFRQGIMVRVVFAYSGTDYPRFLGKIVGIDPTPGRSMSRRTEVIANDLMADLVEADLRNVTLQVDQMEDSLIRTLMEALPIVAQPLALELDAGLDLSPYAFDLLGAGEKAFGPLNQILTSSLGFGSIGPDGIFRYENRQMRQSSVSLFTFDSVNELVTPSTLDGVFNRFRATVHPKTIDAAATTVLWSQTGTPPSLDPGETVELWGDYFNPALTTQKIGGTAQVQPVATTDYLANTLADGTGTNKTANVTVTAVAFASTVKFIVTNNDAGIVFITKRQIRGKALYDLSPVTVESFLEQPYGDRGVTVDMPYQANLVIAQNLVEYLRVQFEDPSQQVTSFMFQANYSANTMLAAMTAQVGDRMTISEEVTGLILAAVFIHSVSLRSTQGLLWCEFGVSSSAFFSTGVWIMDDATYSLAGTSTIFGYA